MVFVSDSCEILGNVDKTSQTELYIFYRMTVREDF